MEEEIGGNGTLSMVLHGVESDEVVVLETTELNVFRGQRGCLGFSIALTGRSAHMGSHTTGINAIEAAYDVLVALKAFEQEMLDEAGTDPDFSCWERPVKLNLGIIRGWRLAWDRARLVQDDRQPGVPARVWSGRR